MSARYVVRYGKMRHLGEFAAAAPHRRGDRVVVQTARGTELGDVLCVAGVETAGRLDAAGPPGRVLRPATADDERRRDECRLAAERAFAQTEPEIARHGLAMQLVDVERLLGGEKMLFFYTAEARVDFRELVKSLAKRFRTRIEMRQIGVRDEAKLLADYGDCGKPVCCNTHLTETPPVTMRMAKLQKASLDPDKITGRCGRLKCCLRYEFDTYEAHQKELPKVGRTVQTPHGRGRVLAHELLAKKLLVSTDDGRRVLVDAAEATDAAAEPPPAAAGGESKAKKRRARRRRAAKEKPD